MSDEQLEFEEALFWVNDPPEKEDEEPEEDAVPEGEGDENDPLAPTGEGDPKPIDADGG